MTCCSDLVSHFLGRASGEAGEGCVGRHTHTHTDPRVSLFRECEERQYQECEIILSSFLVNMKYCVARNAKKYHI